jgi:hypothetical protein
MPGIDFGLNSLYIDVWKIRYLIKDVLFSSFY